MYSKLTFSKSRNGRIQTGDLANSAHPFTFCLNTLMSSNLFPVLCGGPSATYQNCVQISLANRNSFCLGLSSSGILCKFIIFVTGTLHRMINFMIKGAFWGGEIDIYGKWDTHIKQSDYLFDHTTHTKPIQLQMCFL